MIRKLLDDQELWRNVRDRFVEHALNIRCMEYTFLVHTISVVFGEEIKEEISKSIERSLREVDYGAGS